uniref:NADH-ubiquinone oxidoreductase chain 3 n=1 Tax=Eubranchipus grubii TaxID=381661 RepID=A0A7D7K1Y0_9CRUS|nr:NADH dehydrogenase subunit 3 [Eubranchipus grubii]QMP96534.1 NADH dehydrogenase subunit 3 [Eubranchipus grubii]
MVSISLLWTSLILLSTLMLFMSSVINKKTIMEREKNSPFECGFDPQNSTRMPFSLRFFIITLIFLIFDVEITILLPINYMTSLEEMSVTIISFFIIILVMGVLYEWEEGALSWIN